MKIIILITIICITLTGCDPQKAEKKDIIKVVPESSLQNKSDSLVKKQNENIDSKPEKKNTRLSVSDMKEELMEYEKKIEFAMNSDDTVNSKDLASVLEKSIKYWSDAPSMTEQTR